MKLKKLFNTLLTCALAAGILSTAAAAGFQNTIPLEELDCEIIDLSAVEYWQDNARVLGTIDTTVSPGKVAAASKSFALESGTMVTIECTYSPASASVDFGLIAPNGRFYYKNSTTGSIDTTIKISERGYYTLAVRNNSSKSVTVSGSVDY